MAKSRRKTQKSSILTIIIFVLGIGILSALTVFNYFNYKREIKKKQTLTAEVKEIKKSYQDTLDNYDSLVKEKEEIEHLDETIANLKTEVFTLASQVEAKIKAKETNYKIAYITFDDGPYYGTNTVIETLRKYKVKATFFTIGLDKETCYDNRSASCAEMYKKIVDNGHTIANHTYSHLIFKGLYTNANTFIEQVKKQEELIKERTGVITNIVRFPGGINSSSALAGWNQREKMVELLRENHYGWVDWTAQDGDGGNLTSRDVGWRNFTNSINDSIEVILFHDYNKVTISMLPDVIEYLENSNYILLPLFYESVMINK